MESKIDTSKYHKMVILDADVYDLCIVGAGMFGCAAARHASANPTLKVCLIGPEEPKDESYKNREIFGAHYDEGRIVHATEANEVYQTLNRESISRFRELERLSGIKFYHPSGSLLVFDRLHEECSVILRSNRPGDNQTVDLSATDAFQKRFPFLKLKENMRVFLDDMGAGYISPRKMTLAQKKVAQSQGCILIHEVVNEVKQEVHGMHEVTTESGLIVKAKRVLLCPGAFLNFKRLYSTKKLKVSLRKETSVLMRIPEEEAKRLSSMPTIITRGEGPECHPDIIGAYILPPIKYPDDMYYLKIGHIGEISERELKSLEDITEWYRSKGNEEVIQFSSKKLKDMLPGLKVEEIRGRSCVTCDSPSGFPYIDRLTPTVTVAAVGNSRGAAMCEEVGRIAAELSIAGKWDTKVSRYLFEAIYE